MVFDVSVAMTWLLFLALFAMVFVWFRRGRRILDKRGFSEVAIKRGESPANPANPANPAKWAPYTLVINGLAGAAAMFVTVGVVVADLAYEIWSAIAGTTLWRKFLRDFALSRHAHGFGPRSQL